MIGIVGDVHTRDQDLAAALAFLADRCSALYCVGDLTDGPGDVVRCLALLREYGVATVLGNHDDWCLKKANLWAPHATRLEALSPEDAAFLGSLPRTLDMGQGALLCHGLGDNLMGKVNPDDEGYALEANDDLDRLVRDRRYRLVVNGHSHRPMVRTIRGLTIINAGVLGGPAGFLTLDLDTRAATFYGITDGEVVRWPDCQPRGSPPELG